jgi:hypothetical protein
MHAHLPAHTSRFERGRDLSRGRFITHRRKPVKKTLVRLASPVPTPPAPRRQLGTRLGGSLALLAVLGTVGLFTSARPAHTAGGPIAVNVANTVLNRDVDSPARQPFAHEDYLTIAPGALYVNDSVPVPAGKRLVIEDIEVFSANTPVDLLSLQASSSGGSAYWHLSNFTTNADGYVEASRQVRWYADSYPLTVVVSRQNAIGSGTVSVSLSGYLIDVP